jgi:hypothetical protein
MVRRLHPAPKKQFFCCLQGSVEVATTDGEKRTFKSGELLLDDIKGKGHTNRVLGKEDFLVAVVQLA